LGPTRVKAVQYPAADGTTIPAYLTEGSPLQNAARIKVPVLLFHGTLDRNVEYKQSVRMAAALTAAHNRCELVTFDERCVFARDDGSLIKH
jgi:dipeptidyl aminopeptidase/acylaminoacyl peptidase